MGCNRLTGWSSKWHVLFLLLLAGGNAFGQASLTNPGGVTSFNTRTGAVTLTSGDVNAAITPCTFTSGALSGCTSLALAGSDPVITLPSNPSHSPSTSQLWSNAGTVEWNNGTATTHLAQIIASGTVVINPGAISSGTCSAITVSAPNVTTADVPTAAANANPTGTTGYLPTTVGGIYFWVIPSAGNVNFYACNPQSGTITPASITLNWQVPR
jgi:hypothetical protein